MKLRDKLLITLAFLCLLGVSIINFVSIERLKKHHILEHDKYSYAYDCIREAELKYWETKADLVNEVQSYIDLIAPTSNLRGYAIVDECEKYNVDICFVLAQGEIESHFGTRGMASRFNCVFNVGIYDGANPEEIEEKYKCDYPNESIQPYLELLNKKYLVNKMEYDLMLNYVDINGARYASDVDYEAKLSARYKYIKENTKILEYYNLMKNYAIKCNR